MPVLTLDRTGPRRRLWWRFLGLVVRPRLAHALASIALDGYLADTGWLRTVETGVVGDATGQPLPWATYPFIEFISPRLQPTWRMFEYGGGASTLFFAARLGEVWAVDHDAEFARKLAPRLPPNAHLRVAAEGSPEYLTAIDEAPAAPHLVSIDGRDRVRCVEPALRRVATDGVIVFDDTEREAYRPGLERLAAAGFRRLDFWGISAGAPMHRCTSVFYRRDNVLGI